MDIQVAAVVITGLCGVSFRDVPDLLVHNAPIQEHDLQAVCNRSKTKMTKAILAYLWQYRMTAKRS